MRAVVASQPAFVSHPPNLIVNAEQADISAAFNVWIKKFNVTVTETVRRPPGIDGMIPIKCMGGGAVLLHPRFSLLFPSERVRGLFPSGKCKGKAGGTRA